ncbi:MAG: hypothetical protein IKB88_02525 [Clostridia bacterium]|nr:hypothetical protein [Clostridia bacterium]
MKYYSIVALISAVIHSALGISICRNKLKAFVNIMCKNSERYKILGGYFIAIGLVLLGCAVAALRESTGAFIYLVICAVIVSIIISLIRRESV